jgi:hypothetical protein
MADALGESPLSRDRDDRLQLTRTREDRYLDLHRNMLFAVQVFGFTRVDGLSASAPANRTSDSWESSQRDCEGC